MKHLFLLALLLLPSVAWATPYTSSVLIDLTTLSFSGIGFQLAPVSLNLYAQVEERLPQNYGGPHLVDGTSDLGWPDRSVNTELAQTGSARGIADATQLFASTSFFSERPGDVGVSVYRYGELMATEVGDLTVSVDYIAERQGLLTANPRLESGVDVWLRLGNAGLDLNDRRFPLQGTDGVERGTLSVTRPFTSGERVLFLLGATTVASVPEPTSWLLLLVGLLGLFVIRRLQTRRHAA